MYMAGKSTRKNTRRVIQTNLGRGYSQHTDRKMEGTLRKNCRQDNMEGDLDGDTDKSGRREFKTY
jgi:hypothetical protein